MRASTRVLCVVAAFAAALTVASAVSSCGIDHCTTCALNLCTLCEDGYYPSGNVCVPCSENCRTCTVLGQCLVCNDGYDLKYVQISNGTLNTSTVGMCVAKSEPASCTDPQCTSCVAGVCLTCSSGYYLSGGACVSCATDFCSHCAIAGICLGCQDGYYLAGTTCKSCKSEHCKECAIVGRCLACDDGYKLHYVQSTVNESTIYRWGNCVLRSNGAVFSNAYTALTAVGAALLSAAAF